MYSRKVTISKEGKATRVKPLTGLEELTFSGVGKLEAFYTDGLRTLLYTLKDAEEMWEKTLRYPGHVEKIKLLKNLGFFDEKPVEVQGFSVSPRELTAELFERKLRKPEVRDIVAMLIEVGGVKNGRQVTYTYRLLDRYDKRRGVTAMARITAYTTSIVAQLLAKKAMEEKGVVPPEKIGMNERLYKKLMGAIRKRGVVVTEAIS